MKNLFSILALLSCIALISGCGVSRNDYNVALTQVNELQEKSKSLGGQLESLKADYDKTLKESNVLKAENAKFLKENKSLKSDVAKLQKEKEDLMRKLAE